MNDTYKKENNLIERSLYPTRPEHVTGKQSSTIYNRSQNTTHTNKNPIYLPLQYSKIKTK